MRRIKLKLNYGFRTLRAAAGVVLVSCSLELLFAQPAKVPYSSLATSLEWVGVAIEEPGYTIWGGAPIIGEDGKTHLFCARWPEDKVDPAWRKSSEIAHYVADRPEGPFRFVDVVATGTGRNTWDRYAPHNPEIQKFGDTYALVYIANTDYNRPPHNRNQSIGMMVSKSVYGPWKKVPHFDKTLAKAPRGENRIDWSSTGQEGLLITASPDPKHWTHGWFTVNPGVIEAGGKYQLYFKSWRTTGTAIGMAVSDHLEGPYRMGDAPLMWVDDFFIESPVPFWWDGKLCLLTSDNAGKLTGITGALALWVSEDGGMTFPRTHLQVGVDLIPRYFHAYDAAKVTRIYAGHPKIEEARILSVGGRPAYLYGSSGWAVHGGTRTATYVFRVRLPKGAGPLENGPR